MTQHSFDMEYHEPSIPISMQIRCVEREISFRERVYAKRVESGRMSQGESTHELTLMRAVLKTLQRLHAKNVTIASLPKDAEL